MCDSNTWSFCEGERMSCKIIVWSQGFSKDLLLARYIYTLSELPVNKRWSTAGLNATAMTSASCACTLSFGSKDERVSQLQKYTSALNGEKKC